MPFHQLELGARQAALYLSRFAASSAHYGWPADRARDVLVVTRSSGLLQLADGQVRSYPRPQRATVFVHGDIWGGNMLWRGDTCLALIDWKTARAGDPGVDLGELRLQMALQYGPAAPAHVLDGWQRAILWLCVV